MKKLSLIIAAVFIFGVANVVRANGDGDTDNATHNLTVNVPLFALVDVEDDGSAITLAPGISEQAGAPLNFNAPAATNNQAYLNYTSIVGNNSGNGNGNGHGNNGKSNIASRQITAKINNALNGTGVAIQVTAGSYVGTGSGTHGDPVGAVVLESGSAKDLINGIGSSYTGNGTGNGHRLTYKLVQTVDGEDNIDYAALTSGSYSVDIIYTITDRQ